MVPPEESDSALVARALRNDARATELLVRRHLRAAVAVAMAVLARQKPECGPSLRGICRFRLGGALRISI